MDDVILHALPVFATPIRLPTIPVPVHLKDTHRSTV